MGHTKVEVSTTDISTTATQMERANPLSGSGHYSDLPPSPASSAAAHAFGVHFYASSSERKTKHDNNMFVNTQELSSQDARAAGSSSAQRRLASNAASSAGPTPTTSSFISSLRSDKARLSSAPGPLTPPPYLKHCLLRYARDRGLRLDRRPFQIRRLRTCIKRRSGGNGSLRLERRPPKTG